MQGFNHVSGGIAFTGIFASFSNVNIFEKPEYIGATVIFSLLADVDHTRSLVGKLVFPLAKWINTKFGHRTITHSLIFYLALLVVIGTLESFFNFSRSYFIIAAFSYGSHLIFDMCTKQGIPLFWPFTRRPAVLPGNPNLRLAVNDFRSEAIVFLVFCSLTFFCLPLMANGFWVSYRKYFLTSENIKKEFLQSEDYLNIFYTLEGTPGNSTLIDFQGSKYIFLTNDILEIVPPEKVKLIDFQHTQKKRGTRVISIFQGTSDSLKVLLQNKIIRSGQLQSNQKIQYFDNTIMKESNTVQIEWKKNFDFYLVDSVSNNASKIQVLREQKREIQQRYLSEVQAQNRIKRELEELNKQVPSSDYEAGKQIIKRKELENKISSLPIISLPSSITLDLQIESLRVPPAKRYLSANLILEDL